MRVGENIELLHILNGLSVTEAGNRLNLFSSKIEENAEKENQGNAKTGLDEAAKQSNRLHLLSAIEPDTYIYLSNHSLSHIFIKLT